MLRLLGIAALILFAISAESLWAAESATSSGPPAWQDGASVYLDLNGSGAPPAEQQPAAASDNRRLPPPGPSAQTVRTDYGTAQERGTSEFGAVADFGLPLNTVYTVVSALAIVIGAFLLCAWLLKRSGRVAAQALPAEVVSVLGRVPLDQRQTAQLLRVGNKLVLISLSAAAAKTLTEVTDPAEVDRIVGLCQQSLPHSTTKAFEQVFQQLSREPAAGGFLGNTPAPATPMPSLDMFRAKLGEVARA
jgi:flagellar biogenesis protein FliO